MEQTMFSIYQNKPAPTALELSLPWKQKKLQAQEESMEKCTTKTLSLDDPCCSDEVQLARHISTLSCSSPRCDSSPVASPIHGENNEESLLSHPEPSAISHIPHHHPGASNIQPRTQHSHGVPKVFSMNDMDQGHFHLGVNDTPALHASTNSCCGLTDISGISPPPSSSHLPWRDQQSSERPLRCSETHINCITANDIESHHRQCIHSKCVVGEMNEAEVDGTPLWYCCESGLSRRRSMQSFQHTSMSSHHNLHDFPHHAHAHMHQLHHHHVNHHHYHHHQQHHASNVCHGSRKPFNILGDDDDNVPAFSQLASNPEETEHFFNQLENRVRAWFERMDTEDICLGEEEENKIGKFPMIVGGKEEEDDEYDFGCDARDMYRLNRCGSGTHKFLVESSSQSRGQPQTCSSPQTIAPVDSIRMCQISTLSIGVSSLLCPDQPLQSTESFTDYSDSNQHTIHANPRI